MLPWFVQQRSFLCADVDALRGVGALALNHLLHPATLKKDAAEDEDDVDAVMASEQLPESPTRTPPSLRRGAARRTPPAPAIEEAVEAWLPIRARTTR